MAGFNIANFNLYNFAKRFWDMFGNPTPMDVEVPQKNSNGDIETYLCPNLAKFKKRVWDYVGGALGQFNRTFYVDAENGDDNNDGSSGSPFKTLKKACDSVPIGGKGSIGLKSDITINNNITGLTNKYLWIGSSDASVQRKITFKTYTDSSNNTYTLSRVYLTNVSIWFKHIDFIIEAPDTTNGTLLSVSWPGRYCFVANDGYNYLYLNRCSVTVNEDTNNNAFLFYGAIGGDNGSITLGGQTYQVDFIKDTGCIFYIPYTSAVLNFRGATYKDTAGNARVFTDIVSGVNRDAGSGNPVNLVSNINFSS